MKGLSKGQMRHRSAHVYGKIASPIEDVFGTDVETDLGGSDSRRRDLGASFFRRLRG